MKMNRKLKTTCSLLATLALSIGAFHLQAEPNPTKSIKSTQSITVKSSQSEATDTVNPEAELETDDAATSADVVSPRPPRGHRAHPSHPSAPTSINGRGWHISELSPTDPDHVAFRKTMEKHEKAMHGFEQEMKQAAQEMEKVARDFQKSMESGKGSGNMEKFQTQMMARGTRMESIGRKMQVQGDKMRAAGEKFAAQEEKKKTTQKTETSEEK